MIVPCENCGVEFDKPNNYYNRAKRTGAKIFCSRQCFADSRKTTKAEKIEVKRLYDLNDRINNSKEYKARKKRYYNANAKEIYKRQRARRDNDEARAKHASYCSGPEYREKEKINRYIRTYGADWETQTKFCISCEEDKHIFEFESFPVFPDGRRHICNDCENEQLSTYGVTTRGAMNAIVMRRYSSLTRSDVAKAPYLIEANKFLILLKRELR